MASLFKRSRKMGLALQRAAGLLALLVLLIACGKDEGVAPRRATDIPKCSRCRIFISWNGLAGNFGGTANPDALCNSDNSKPAGGGTYKALVAVPGKRQFPSTDWPLKPSIPYYHSNGTTYIGTTSGSGTFSFALQARLSSELGIPWTGLNPNWTLSNSHCSGWTTASSGQSGTIGLSTALNSDSISLTTDACDEVRMFYCVEQ